MTVTPEQAYDDVDDGGLFDPSSVSPFILYAAFRPTGITAEKVTGVMDLGPEQHTPWGVVHGGVYSAAVESAASLGATAAVAESGRIAVGISNSTDFLRSFHSGRLDVEAVPVHHGRRHQVWQVSLVSAADGALVAIGRVRLESISAPAAVTRPNPPHTPAAAVIPLPPGRG